MRRGKLSIKSSKHFTPAFALHTHMKRCPKAGLLIGAVLLLPLGGATAGEALARANNCLSCHAVERKLVGPAFKSVAARYAADPEAPARLATKVLKGGSGVWGNAVMPPNPKLSEAEARQLVGWILGLK